MTPRSTALGLMFAFLTIGGCGVPRQTHATQLEDNDVRIETPTTTTQLANGLRARHIDICLVSGDHLTAILTALPAPVTVARALRALVMASQTVLPNGTRSTINNPDLFASRATAQGVAQVDVNEDFHQFPRTEQILMLSQVVCTLTSMPGVGQVHFAQDGRPIDVPRADGSFTTQPVSRFDYLALLPR